MRVGNVYLEQRKRVAYNSAGGKAEIQSGGLWGFVHAFYPASIIEFVEQGGERDGIFWYTGRVKAFGRRNKLVCMRKTDDVSAQPLPVWRSFNSSGLHSLGSMPSALQIFQNTANTGVSVLHIVHWVLGVLLNCQVQVEVDTGVGFIRS